MISPRDELWHGFQQVIPVMIAIIPFGLIVGITAAKVGFGPVLGIGASAIVFAGASQLAAMALYAKCDARRKAEDDVILSFEPRPQA